MQFIEQYDKLSSDFYGDGFVGMNTADGFKGCYDHVIDENTLQRLYIIKGAAGTGKSTLLRRIAESCAKYGYGVERFACGSDPTSLDCIIIESKIAVLDGTPPHSVDMAYPGAVSELIDLSSLWNRDQLIDMRSEIEHHTSRKAEYFRDATRAMRSLRALADDNNHQIKSAVDMTKLKCAIARLVSSIKPKGDGDWSMVCLRSIGMKGKSRLDILERSAEKHIVVSDVYGSSYVFMQQLLNYLRHYGYGVIWSPDPIDPSRPCDVYVPTTGVLFTVENTESADKTINMRRFVDADRLADIRGSLRLSQKCTRLIMDDVISSLSKAGEHHFALEKIYSSAMDYLALDRLTEEKTREIITTLG